VTAVALCRGSSELFLACTPSPRRQKSASLVSTVSGCFGDLQFPLRWFGGNQTIRRIKGARDWA